MLFNFFVFIILFLRIRPGFGDEHRDYHCNGTLQDEDGDGHGRLFRGDGFGRNNHASTWPSSSRLLHK